MTDVETTIPVGINSATKMRDDDQYNDEDEMAELFSFGSTMVTQNDKDGNIDGNIYRISSTISDDPNVATSSDAPFPASLVRSDSVGSHDSFMDMLDAESSAIMDLTRTLDLNDGSKQKEFDGETTELLQWLDTTGRRNDISYDKEEDVETITFHADDTHDTTAIATAPDSHVTQTDPIFASLVSALQSTMSTKEQIRKISENKLLKCEPLFSSPEEGMTYRPELYCRMICGNKSLAETGTCSLADSFEQWRYHLRQHQTIKSDNEDLHLQWIRKQAQLLSQNISMATGRASEDCEMDLNDLLIYHYHNDITSNNKHNAQNDQNESTNLESLQKTESDAISSSNDSNDNTANKESASDAKSSGPKIQYCDALLPAVAAAILSANVPVTAASVVFAQIIPTHMPLLALLPSERWDAALLLHAEFYVLACYHIPLMVLHLDRYIPGWQWPRNRALLLRQLGNDRKTKKESNGSASVSTGRYPTKQGQIPASWLMCHLAGECNISGDTSEEFDKLILDPMTIFRLWDNIFTSTSNNVTRFFLTLAVLEQAADKLILLTGDQLVKGLQSVWSLPEEYFPPDLEWREHLWWSRAMGLQKQTPQSVIIRAQLSEDVAIQETLKQRRLKAEAEIQRRLDAEAAAHKQAQEVLAQQARDRLSRARLVAFYREHAPDKEENIDMIMSAYTGRLDVLDQKLKAKYGVGFNPALDPKRSEDNQEKKTSSNVFFATMNQGLNAFGRQSSSVSNQSPTEEDACTIASAKDQVSVSVSPQELLPILCWSKEANMSRGINITKEQLINFWDNLKFFLVDSRTEESATEQGRFPTALQLPPEFLLDPERIRENEDRFESLRGACHIVIMGEGYSALTKLYKYPQKKLEALIREDEARTNGCALFFFKKGFPFVSILEGGYAGALSWLYREGRTHHLHPSSVLVDYDPEQSLFGQLETLHNSSATEKVQKKMQKLLESSLVTVTKHAQTFEKLSSTVEGSVEKDSGTGNNVTSFINPFVGKSENVSIQPESSQPIVQQPTTDTGSKMQVNNPFKGFGAALNNTLKSASTIAAGNNSAAGNYSYGNTANSTTSDGEAKSSSSTTALPNVLKRNPFSRFGGTGTTTNDDAKKTPTVEGSTSINSGTPSIVVPGFGSLNQFRKTTMARMQQGQRNPNTTDGPTGTIVDLPPPKTKNSDSEKAQIKKL